MGVARLLCCGVFAFLLAVLSPFVFGQNSCPKPELTKTEVLVKAFEALRNRGIGLVSYDNLYVKVERDGCGYRVIIRDDPPKPSGALSVELAPDGLLRRINLD